MARGMPGPLARDEFFEAGTILALSDHVFLYSMHCSCRPEFTVCEGLANRNQEMPARATTAKKLKARKKFLIGFE
jgi:hypothetical protein